MLCSRCFSLDFKYLRDWYDKVQVIEDSYNPAFSGFDRLYPSDEDLARCREGHGQLWTRALRCPSLEALAMSAQKGYHLCARTHLGLIYEDTSDGAGPELRLLDDVKSKPIVLSISAPFYSAWQDADTGEWFRVFCGNRECRLQKLSLLAGKPARDTLLMLLHAP